MADIERQSDERRRDLERRQSSGLGSRFRGLSRDPEDRYSTSPFSLIRRFSEDVDRMFSGEFGLGGFGNREFESWTPAIEVRERDGQLVVHADLPGLNKEDVKVEVTTAGLIVQGERKREQEEERGGIYRSERSYGSFYRLIPLPEGAKIDQAKAQFNNGVLEVTVPIPESRQNTRQIPIEAGDERRPIGSQTGKQATQTSKAG
jgi:HSP20 family protein